MLPVLGMTLNELEASLEGMGAPRWRAGAVLDWIYRKDAASFEGMSDLPAALKRRLGAEASLAPLAIARFQTAADGTHKFLFRLPDGELLESVLIPAEGRWTLCVSTQVGCAVGCTFCASGLAGFTRNLLPAEIVAQVAVAGRELRRLHGGTRETTHIDNLVLMGMGEPFQNYANVMKALGILTAPWGVGIGQRHITVSTSGVPEGIRKFAADAGQIRLAISLHAPTDALRDRLVPLNRRYPLADLLDAVREYQRVSGRQVTWEYVLLKGVNDGRAEAEALAWLVAPFRGHVNLIPFNPVAETGLAAPGRPAVGAFLKVLKEARIPATVRLERGRDIDAACGQLRLKHLKA